MRVPIENGLGFNQPGYQILLSSLLLIGTDVSTCKRTLTYIKFSGGGFFIATENMINIFSSFKASYFLMISIIHSVMFHQRTLEIKNKKINLFTIIFL